MKNHLFLFLVLSFSFGILIIDFYSLPIFYLEISFIFIFLGAFFFKRSRIFIFFTLLGFLILGMLRFQNFNSIPSIHYSNFSKEKKNLGFKLKIYKLEKENSEHFIYKAKVLYLVENKNLIKTQGNLLIEMERTEKSKALLENSEIWAFGKLYEIKENLTSSFNYKKYLARKKIYHKFFIEKNHWKIQKIPKGISFKIQLFKNRLLEKLSNIGFSHSELSIFQALFFGNKSFIDPSLKEVYAKSGAIHFLAISGFHIGILFSIFYFLFYGFIFLPFGKKLRVLAALFMMWTFVFFVGFGPSTTRAAWMLSFYSIFNILKKKPSNYHILSLSAFILLVLNPNILFDVGFELSYLAVFFIFYFYTTFKKFSRIKNRFINYFFDFFSISLSAQLGTFPIVLYYFKIISLFSFFSSLVLTPLLFFLLGFGLFMSALEFFEIFILAGWKLIEKIIFFINHFLIFISSLQPNIFNTISISTKYVFIFYIGIFFIKPILLKIKKI